jgi:hypothetical protein
MHRIASAVIVAAGLALAGGVHAQDKKESSAVTKVLLENDKVRVTESTFKPGDVSRSNRRPRTNYVVQGGTLERTTKDGKKTVYERKTGTAMWMEADSDIVRNVGNTTYIVVGVTNK